MQRLSRVLASRLFVRSPSPLSSCGGDLACLSTESRKELSDETVQLDLKALAENADAETLAEINRLRQAEDDLRSRFAVPSDAAKLDWSQLEGRLLSTGLVESLRKAFESLEPPSLEAEREELLQRIDSSFEPLLKEAQELAQEAEKRLKSLEQMMRELEYVQKNLSSLSVDELLARRPDLAEEVEADLKQSRWFKV